ncbi:flagellar motor switch phosphatase FliY [Clostridia bacterium]|nr:flagellar motor switch phosphatase FliY [Clostridia bacterium]
MDGVLSPEEISALLQESEDLSDVEKDAIGEVGNISMGTASTTLSTLLNQKVDISTPIVSVVTWDEVVESYERPCIFVKIGYIEGLTGNNILILKEKDVKIITDLMMGGDGSNTEDELTELHLSAISEAMNQMMGSAATSLSSMLKRKIDISPPQAELFDLQGSIDINDVDEFLGGNFVRVAFRMEIENLINSEVMQLYPIPFAKEMYNSFRDNIESDTPQTKQASPPPQAAPTPTPVPQVAATPPPGMGQPNMGVPNMGMPNMGAPMMDMSMYNQAPVNVQPAQFSAFAGDFNPITQQENIGLIMDVPLDVTVELGRTSKSIQEILEFSPGTILELNKIAGEPIDVLVNGKYVAKGEVVVIEESFGIRITEIIK